MGRRTSSRHVYVISGLVVLGLALGALWFLDLGPGMPGGSSSEPATNTAAMEERGTLGTVASAELEALRSPGLVPVAAAVARGDWFEVEARLAILSEAPRTSSLGVDGEFLLRLARHAQERPLPETEEALRGLEPWLASHLHAAAARHYISLGDERARTELEAAARTASPAFKERATRELARHLLERGLAKESAEALASCGAIESVEADSLALRSKAALELGHEGEARRIEEVLFWEHPAHPAARSVSDAKKRMREACKQGRHEAVLQRGEALLDANLRKSAAAAARALLDSKPSSDLRDSANLLLGRAERARKRNSQALAALAKVSRGDEVRWARAKYNGSLAARQLKRSGNERTLLAGAESSPVKSEWRDRSILRLADKDESSGRMDAARERWKRVAEEGTQPWHRSRAHWKLSWSFAQEGRFDEALETARSLRKEHPLRRESAAALYWSARWLGEDRADQSRALKEELIDGFPNEYYGALASRELGRAPRLPPAPLPGDAEALVGEALALLEVQAPASAQHLAQLFRLGLIDAALIELAWSDAACSEVTPGWEELRWQLEVVLMGEAGRHRDALIELRRAAPRWRSRSDLPAAVWSAAYPRALDDLLHHYSRENDLDPALVFALVHQESTFDPRAKSWVGARGLMQIMPGTGRTIARWENEQTRTELLFDPERNVRYGTLYLKRLLDNLGLPELALAGYNAGGSRARRWWGELPEPDIPLFVESIPFRETRDYVKLVTWNRLFYSQALGVGRGEDE